MPANSLNFGSVTVSTRAPSASRMRSTSSSAAVTSGWAGISVSWKCRMKPMRRPATPRSSILPKSADVGLGAAGVARIVASQRLQQQCVIGDGAGHRADMIQREGQRKHAAAADEAIGRLQADDAANAGGIAHRTAGVGAKCQAGTCRTPHPLRSRRTSRPGGALCSTDCVPEGTAGRSSARRWRIRAC